MSRRAAIFFRFLAFLAVAIPCRAAIRYEVSLAHPEQHLFRVTMEIPEVSGTVTVQMPAWNALYQIRDFSSHVQQVEAAHRIGASVCEVHTGPYAHAFHARGRDAESPAVVSQLKKIRKAGERIRALGMRFNAGHALNYFNVGPVASLPGVRELHIGHAIVSRAVFVGMREAVREMKRLITDAAK